MMLADFAPGIFFLLLWGLISWLTSKKKKKIGEALESKDIEIIKKLIRDVIGDVYRDIWIKRNSWK